MSAEALSGRLLAEVQEEGLHEFLDDLRKLSDSQPSSVLGLPHLDRLLETFRKPVLPSAVQDARWTSPAPTEGTSLSNFGHATLARGHTAIIPERGGLRPSVIQLTGNDSGVGKTAFCYLLTTLAVLPQDYNGRQHEVVWFDADGRFSATRLQSVLVNHLSISFPILNLCESKAIGAEALRHVHVFRPQSSSQLVSTLVSLPGCLLRCGGSTGHFTASRSLGLIVLDSATAFYWQDRSEAELARLEALGTGENAAARPPARSSRTSEVITELKKLQKLFDSTILFTSTPYVKSSITTASTGSEVMTNDGRLLPQEQPRVSPWTGFATLSLSVTQEQVRQFTTQMSLEECQRDQTNRLAAVARGRSIVFVDRTMRDTWASGVRDTMDRLDGQGSFGIRMISIDLASEK